jgi:hypothetical protein
MKQTDSLIWLDTLKMIYWPIRKWSINHLLIKLYVYQMAVSEPSNLTFKILLTQWSRTLLEEVIVCQLVNRSLFKEPNVHCRAHKRTFLDPTSSHTKPVETLKICISEIQLDFILSCKHTPPKSAIKVVNAVHLILFDFVILAIFMKTTNYEAPHKVVLSHFKNNDNSSHKHYSDFRVQ